MTVHTFTIVYIHEFACCLMQPLSPCSRPHVAGCFSLRVCVCLCLTRARVCVCAFLRVMCTQTCAVADWAAQLRRMRFAHVGAVHLIAFSDMDPITWPDPAKLPGIFRACLTLANALPCKADSLTLYGWAATASFVELLARLPKWTGELKLVLQGGVSHGYYPLASASIPTTYTKWVIRDEEDFALTPAEREAFLMHAPSSRTAETPLHIRVISASSYGFGQADAQWRALGVCEHVTIEYGTW